MEKKLITGVLWPTPKEQEIVDKVSLNSSLQKAEAYIARAIKYTKLLPAADFHDLSVMLERLADIRKSKK